MQLCCGTFFSLIVAWLSIGQMFLVKNDVFFILFWLLYYVIRRDEKINFFHLFWH
jgi:hypothetical protein